MTYFLSAEKDAAGFREVRKEFLGEEPPAATLVFVSLDGGDIKVEIEAIAVV